MTAHSVDPVTAALAFARAVTAKDHVTSLYLRCRVTDDELLSALSWLLATRVAVDSGIDDPTEALDRVILIDAGEVV